MNQHDKAVQFAALHRAPGAFVMPNPWDAGSARVLASIGFRALATTSAGLAFALGRRDAEGLLSRDETLANAAAIVRRPTCRCRPIWRTALAPVPRTSR